MLTLAEKRWFLPGSKKLMMLLKANQKKVCNFKTTKNGSKVKKRKILHLPTTTLNYFLRQNS